ncbi:MAG: argininosuccinate synthase, partial [Candidatus Dormibacteraceae bacterium]
RDCPKQPRIIELGFREGVPISLDGQELNAVELVERLNALGGEHGVGRIDLVENRLVGIKSREIYEAPAAVILLQAHQALEALTLTKEVARFKEQVAGQWAQLVYDGLWFSPLREALYAFVAHSQQFVNGEVRIKLGYGTSQVVGRKSKDQLYRTELATYGRDDEFDQQAAVGFIKLWGLGIRTVAEVQGQLAGVSLERLAASSIKRLAAPQPVSRG